jgi:hypothetical protein
MFKSTLPNSIRQGLGLSTSAQQVDITAGDAVIAGRWVWTDTGDNVVTTGLGDGDYYVVWRVELSGGGKPPDTFDRDPQDEVAVFDTAAVSGYTPDEYELVLGKVTVTSDVPVFVAATDKYTSIPDQIATGRIVPRTKSGDGQNSYSSVRIAYASGGVELIDQISTESYGARIFNKLQFDDENGVTPASIKNVDGVLMAREDAATETGLDYVPFDADSYKIDGVTVIKNNREIDNVTIINSTLNNVTWAGNLISTASRSIEMNNAGDTTLTITNTGAGVANVAVEGAVTANNAAFTQPLPVTSGGTTATTPANARVNLGVEIGVDVQTQNAALQSIANLATSADKMIYTSDSNVYNTTPLTNLARSLLDDTTSVAMRSTLGVVIGTNVQAYSVNLNNFAIAANVANRFPYMSGSNSWSYVTSGTTGRAVLATVNTTAARATLGLTIGTNVQAYHATLDEVSGTTPTTDQIILWTSSSSASAFQTGATGRVLMGASSATAARSAISAALDTHVHTMANLGIETIVYPMHLLRGWYDNGAYEEFATRDYTTVRFTGSDDEVSFPIPYIKGKTITNIRLRFQRSGSDKSCKFRWIYVQDGTTFIGTWENFTSRSYWQTATATTDFTNSSGIDAVYVIIASASTSNLGVRFQSIAIEYST